MSLWNEPVRESVPEEGTLSCPVCAKEVGELYVMELTAGPFRACYECFVQNPKAMQQWVWALGDRWRAEERRAEQAESLKSLAELSAPEHHELLKRERAMLNFLSMDLISSKQRRETPPIERLETYGGYDCWSAYVYGGMERTEVTRSNIRQAVAALAEQWYGENWVEEMLGWGEVQQYTDEQAPEGHNKWSGPKIVGIDQLMEEQQKREREMWERTEWLNHNLGETMDRLPMEEEEEALERLLQSDAVPEADRALLKGWWQRLRRPTAKQETEPDAEDVSREREEVPRG